MGISSTNPHDTSLVHLGKPSGLKGLVAYAKCNRDSYDSELDLKILFFALLEDKQSLSVGVFVWVLTYLNFGPSHLTFSFLIMLI